MIIYPAGKAGFGDFMTVSATQISVHSCHVYLSHIPLNNILPHCHLVQELFELLPIIYVIKTQLYHQENSCICSSHLTWLWCPNDPGTMHYEPQPPYPSHPSHCLCVFASGFSLFCDTFLYLSEYQNLQILPLTLQPPVTSHSLHLHH